MVYKYYVHHLSAFEDSENFTCVFNALLPAFILLQEPNELLIKWKDGVRCNTEKKILQP
jgi:hypothetical protein